MREIKFRAWDSARKKMFTAEEMGEDELQLNPDGRGFFNASSVSPVLSQYYPHLIPLQFTGLYDQNGKEIYEGDLLDVDTGNRIMKVFWYTALAQFDTDIVKILDKTYPFYQPLLNSDWPKRCRIIGNIYENPELLEGDGG